MEEQKDMLDLLDLMIQPVFCVKENTIIRANGAAMQLLLSVGQDIRPLLHTGAEEYAEFTGGRLYLTLDLSGLPVGAAVQRLGDTDVFELETDHDNSTLQAMALAASQLRRPLAGALAGTAELLDTQEDPQTRRQLSLLNQRLYQLLRVLGNMSDAEYTHSHCRMETADAAAVLRETFEKAGTLMAASGITLTYQDWNEPVYCLLDTALLERAVLNLLSNAMKFSPKGSQITAGLTRRGRTLRLTIQDSGSGIAREVMGSLFQRHLRQPGIEDSRFGLGLGVQLVHSAARHHGGTLLISPGEGGGTRIVLTLAIRQREQAAFRSPVFQVDYTGGFDHALVELSDCLPPELYDGTR